MSYTLCYVVDFGAANTGLTLNAKLFDAVGAQVGSTITTGFVNYSDGSYSYLATIPDASVGSFVIYDSALATRKFRFSVNPQEAENTDAKTSAVKAKTDNLPAAPASTTNITGGTITTVTNLTNAATNGDLTATMKTSVTTAATAATPIAASVSGNVVGSVGSLATQAKADVNAEADTAIADAALATATALTAAAANIATILGQTGTTGVALSTAVKQAIADELLKRSVSNVEASASTHSLAEIILAMLESSAPGSTWTIYRTDHSTVFNTRVLTTDAAALPVTGVN